MATDLEREAFGLVVERNRLSASENDIRAAFQRFLETAGVAPLAEQTTEGHRGSVTLAGWTSTSTTLASSSRPTACGTESPSPSTWPSWTGISRTCSRPAPVSGTASSPMASTTFYVASVKKSCPCCRTERCERSTAQNRRHACGSTCTASSPPRPKTLSPTRRPSKGTSGASPTRSMPATCFCTKPTRSTETIRQWR